MVIPLVLCGDHAADVASENKHVASRRGGQLLTHPEGHKDAEGVFIYELCVSADSKYTNTP